MRLISFIQKVVEIRIDDDQDSIWMSVDIGDGQAVMLVTNHVFTDQFHLEKLTIQKKLK